MVFIIYEKPVGKGRPRFTRNGHTYTPEKTRKFENLVKNEAKKQLKGQLIPDYEGEVQVNIKANFEPPKSMSNKKRSAILETGCTKKPDTDNLAKIILDSLNKIAYKDDSQVTKLKVTKAYANTDYIEVEIKYRGIAE